VTKTLFFKNKARKNVGVLAGSKTKTKRGEEGRKMRFRKNIISARKPRVFENKQQDSNRAGGSGGRRGHAPR